MEGIPQAFPEPLRLKGFPRKLDTAGRVLRQSLCPARFIYGVALGPHTWGEGNTSSIPQP